MKRILSTLMMVLLMCVGALCTTVTSTTKIIGPDGQPFNGTLTLQLPFAGVNSQTNQLVLATPVSIQVFNGLISQPFVIPGNDIMSPKMPYSVLYADSFGVPVTRQLYYITGATFDVGSAPATPNFLNTNAIPATGTTTACINQFVTSITISATTPTSVCASVTSVAAIDGLVGSPAYSFASDPTTGIYKSAASEMSFTLGGTQRYKFQAGGMTIAGGSPQLILNGDTGAFVAGGAIDAFITRFAAGSWAAGTTQGGTSGAFKAGSFIDNSTNPAGTSGVLRIGNNISAVVGRNAANTGDVPMLTLFAGNQIGLGGFGTAQIIWLNGPVRMPNGSPLTWAGTTIGTADTSGLSQLGAASMALGNGANGDFTGSLKLTTLNYITNLQHNGTPIQSSDLSDAASLTTLTGTQTLTNKRVTPRNTALATSTTLTANSDTTDIATMSMTGVTGTLTIAAPTGTPTDGQKLIIRITATNSQTYSFNATFHFSTTTTAPTTIATGKTDYIGCMWNATNTAWDVVAVDQGH